METAVTAAILVAGLAALLLYFRHRAKRFAAAASWPQSVATITASSVARVTSAEDGSVSTSFVPRVGYSYSVNGISHTGKKITLYEKDFKSTAQAQAVIDRYRVGTQVPVYYDPENPADSILERSTDTKA